MSRTSSVGSEEAYRAVEQAAGMQSPNYRFRAEVDRCIRAWREQQEPSLITVKTTAFRRAVLNISADAHRLLSELNRAKAQSQEGWDYEYATIHLGVENTLAVQLTRLIETAKIWVEITPQGRSGRPSTPPIGCLEAAYQNAIGANSRNARPSLGFFRACREQFDLSLPKNDAALRKAVYRRREGPKPKGDKTSLR
jgi:hypothetical protein